MQSSSECDLNHDDSSKSIASSKPLKTVISHEQRHQLENLHNRSQNLPPTPSVGCPSIDDHWPDPSPPSWSTFYQTKTQPKSTPSACGPRLHKLESPNLKKERENPVQNTLQPNLSPQRNHWSVMGPPQSPTNYGAASYQPADHYGTYHFGHAYYGQGPQGYHPWCQPWPAPYPATAEPGSSTSYPMSTVFNPEGTNKMSVMTREDHWQMCQRENSLYSQMLSDQNRQKPN
ncbi:unnamed protein product [Oikopleura dioica]|uniref:Uncharacterized protein n=1 Tax=Oikopleura dioica TaxID=34765 RepID=E4YFT0_OIKDI|nr:unnamed protein product [Oikopleura dioica]